MFFKILCLLLVTINLTIGQKLNYTDCGNGNIKEFRAYPCTSDPCVFKLGSVIDVEADFVAAFDASEFTEVIKGVVRGKELHFPETKKNPCDGYIKPGCPVKKGETYKFKAQFEVKPFYPAIPIQIKYSLVDKHKKVQLCLQADMRIIDPNPKKGRRKGGKNSGNKNKKQ